MRIFISPASGIQAVYHITHIDNVRSILREGVWSHNAAMNRVPKPTTIYNESVIGKRDKKVGDKPLLGFANFYFQPRNAMLYSLCQKEAEVVVLRVKSAVMYLPGAYISIGNAAWGAAEFYPVEERLQKLLEPSMCKQLSYKQWFGDTKQIMMSELLAPIIVPSQSIDFIYAPNERIKAKLEDAGVKIPVELSPHMFFW